MKIVYLHQYFNNLNMSGSTRSFEIARRMVAAGHEVHMITTDRDGSVKKSGTWRITNEEGIIVHWRKVEYSNNLSFYARIIAFLKFMFFAIKKVNELEGDIVYASSTPLTVAVPAICEKFLRRTPFVFEVRDLWPEMPIAVGAIKNPLFIWLLYKLEKFTYFYSDSIVALSPGMQQSIIDRGIESSKVLIAPNSSDVEYVKFEKRPVKHHDFQFNRVRSIVYVGTLGYLNNIDYFVKLALALKEQKSNVVVKIYGDGSELDRCVSLAIASGVHNTNLFFCGNLTKSEVPDVMREADLSFVSFLDIPEMQKNSANKFFDSLAAGKPIAINFGGWMEGLINEHNCGIALNNIPFNEVARILHDKCNNDAWLSEAGYNARELAENDFDRNKIVEKIINFVELTYTKETHTNG